MYRCVMYDPRRGERSVTVRISTYAKSRGTCTRALREQRTAVLATARSSRGVFRIAPNFKLLTLWRLTDATVGKEIPVPTQLMSWDCDQDSEDHLRCWVRWCNVSGSLALNRPW